MITARISGLRQALAQLEKIKNKQQAEIKRAFTVSALNVEREAKRNAPVDTGRLRSDIQRMTFFKDGIVVEAAVFNTVHYAPTMEFGPRPYLFPAWERERPKLLNELRKAL
jgi:HK97 gp10 family phage protein